jgi:biotin-dependent carboxylase-like uncharacterized protein
MLTILHPGNYASLQDLGRWKMHAFGIPLSGAMDRNSAMLANILVDNPIELPVIEFAMVGPKIQWNQSGTAAWTGGDFEVESNLNGAIPRHLPIQFEEHEIWSFGAVKKGLRGYLAVKGGLVGPKVMGSCSMSLGVTDQVVFKKNDSIPFGTVLGVNTSTYSQLKETPLEEREIWGYKGPEWYLWEKATGGNLEKQTERLSALPWTISKDHNRMGIRLLPHAPKHNYSILTAPVLPGTVQWTPSGQLIVLMREGQTTGGYPRILQLTEGSINVLAQKNTNQSIYIAAKELNL